MSNRTTNRNNKNRNNRNNNRTPKSITTQKKNPAKALVLYTTAFIILILAIFMINRANTNSQDLTRVEELPTIVNQPVIGQEDAKVTMIEFGDYKCPSCKQWNETVYPELKSQYIDTGKMKLVYINTLFHGDESELGAIAGEAVLAQNQESFWSFHKALFQAQPTANHNEHWITEEKIMELAQAVTPSIDLQKLKSDIENKITIPEVGLDSDLVDKYRITQTPTLMINGIIMDNPFDVDAIRAVLEQELGG